MFSVIEKTLALTPLLFDQTGEVLSSLNWPLMRLARRPLPSDPDIPRLVLQFLLGKGGPTGEEALLSSSTGKARQREGERESQRERVRERA